MATEFAVFPFLKGQTPHEPTSTTRKILQEGYDTLAKQPGFQRLYWGTEVENPNTWRLAIDWDSIEHHQKFINSEAYEPFVQHLGQVIDVSNGSFFHAHLSPHPAQTAISQPDSPVTEVILAFFPSTYSPADQEHFDRELRKVFVETLEKHAKDVYTGYAGGWIVEEQPIPDSSSASDKESGGAEAEKAKEAKKGKAYIGLIGWTSVQAHLDFRNTQAFKDNIHVLRGAKDLQAMRVVHVSSQRGP